MLETLEKLQNDAEYSSMKIKIIKKAIEEATVELQKQLKDEKDNLKSIKKEISKFPKELLNEMIVEEYDSF